MNSMEHIRTNVFGVSQTVFAEIAGASQASVSRWETGELKPDLGQVERIRQEAKARSLPWKDAWLFRAPSSSAAIKRGRRRSRAA